MRTFVAKQTKERWKRLSEELHRAAASPEDAGAIHDLRVAIRRFVQCLRSFAGFFEKDAIKRVRKPLRKLMRQCGNVRNCDISIELLRDVGLGEDAAIAMLRGRRAEKEESLRKTLKKWRKRKLEWKEKPGSPGEEPWKENEPPEVNAARVLPAMLAEWVRAGNEAAAPGATYEQIHRFRIEGKRLRYTAELFQTFYGEAGGKILDVLKTVQDRLGELNDCVTALELVKDRRPAQAAITKLLKQRETAFRTYWKKTFGPQTVKLWKSTFSDTAKPSRAARASKEQRAR